MCLILFAYRTHSERPLVVAANRDEFYARPALAAHFWEDAPQVFGGRDMEADGTWLAVAKSGRFAAVTNYTDFDAAEVPPGSRGDLPRYFLQGDAPAADYVEAIDGAHYRGYNFLAYDGTELWYTCNRTNEARALGPGVYALTNTRLGDEWPKAVSGRAALEAIAGTASLDDLIEILRDERIPPDELLPKRGRGLDAERRAAACFIRGEQYGTRASTAVIVTPEHIEFAEQLYGPMGSPEARVGMSEPRTAVG